MSVERSLINKVKPSPKKILLGQLANLGDCLYATAIAKQIKSDFPDCHLTWAIGNRCRFVFAENPHVDEVWEINIGNTFQELEASWFLFEKEARSRKKRGIYHEIF